MRSNKLLALAAALPFILSLGGCSAARDVEIKGTVTTDRVQGTIFVEIYDVQDDQAERVHTLTMSAPETFTVNVPLEGDSVLVRAIDDVDGNEACSEGEQWWEIKVKIKNGEVPPLGFPLREAPCSE